MLMSRSEETWFVYILRCADGTLYTGITKDVSRRLEQHQSGLGAKYTRGRTPLVLVYVEPIGSHGEALSREYAVKSMSLKRKQSLLERYRLQHLEVNV
jgi:putative endonuclease